MKRLIKITIILLMTIVIFGNVSNVYADTNSVKGVEEERVLDYGDIFSTGDDFIKRGKDGDMRYGTNQTETFKINETEIKNNASNIFNILLAIGTVLTVIVGGILGIKFMFAGIEERAKIKEALIPYIVGGVVIFGAFIIWKFVVDVLDQI